VRISPHDSLDRCVLSVGGDVASDLRRRPDECAFTGVDASMKLDGAGLVGSRGASVIGHLSLRIEVVLAFAIVALNEGQAMWEQERVPFSAFLLVGGDL